MRRWFLSFNSSDRALAERLKVSIEREFGLARLLRCDEPAGGGYWQPALAQGIDEADAFVLLVGEKGLGPWQRLEYLRGPRQAREVAGRHAAAATGRLGDRRRARGACQRIPLTSSAVGGRAATTAHAQARDRARGRRADSATRSALGVHGR